MAAAEKGTHVSDVQGEDDELDEEQGEVIESSPPLKVSEERELANCPGFKKKLLRLGIGWDSPEFEDEVTIHYVGTLLDGSKFESTRDKGGPVSFKLDDVVAGLDQAIITMKKGECALFTLPPELGYGASGCEGVPQNSAVQFEVELISWITVVYVKKMKEL